MAIARDTNTNYTDLGSSSPGSFNHTASGTDRYVFVFVANEAGDNVTGVTYGGATMTQLVKGRNGAAGTGFLYIYGLANPATGSQSVSVSFSSGTTWGGAMSYTGAQQTDAADATGSNGGGSGTTVTTTVTTVADNAIAVGTGLMDNGNITASTGATLVGTRVAFQGTANSMAYYESSTFPITPAQAYDMTVTGAAGSNRRLILASIAPAAAVGPANLKTYNTNVKANIKTIDTNPIANVKTLNTNA